MAYIHRTFIVPADLAPLARQLTVAIAGAAGEGMFTTPLSADGNEPATHFISSGMIEDTFVEMLASPEALYQMADEYASLEQCTDLLERSDISEDSEQDAMDRLGLTMVQNHEI